MVLLFYVLLPIPIIGRMMIPPVPYSNYNQLEKSKVNVDVFYESLCPDSKNFFLNTLSPTLSQFSPYISVTLVPYGKAKLTRREPGVSLVASMGQMSVRVTCTTTVHRSI